jgi:hypothetical protein
VHCFDEQTRKAAALAAVVRGGVPFAFMVGMKAWHPINKTNR